MCSTRQLICWFWSCTLSQRWYLSHLARTAWSIWYVFIVTIYHISKSTVAQGDFIPLWHQAPSFSLVCLELIRFTTPQPSEQQPKETPPRSFYISTRIFQGKLIFQLVVYRLTKVADSLFGLPPPAKYPSPFCCQGNAATFFSPVSIFSIHNNRAS